MKLFEFIFQLGVVFAVFTFLWWVFTAILYIFRGGPSASWIEVYTLKLVNYFFLVAVFACFCFENKIDLNGSSEVTGNVIGSMILLMYLLAKVQRKENQRKMMLAFGNFSKRFQSTYRPIAEWVLIAVAIVLLVLFIYFPEVKHNSVTDWFVASISNIIDTPVFGFIFKVVGFFIMLRIVFKFIGGLLQLIGMRPPVQVSSNFHFSNKDKSGEKFDDYEEME